MIHLRVSSAGAKHIRISGINPLLAACLAELPQILEQRDSPAAHTRLFPNPTDADDSANESWQSLISPDLHHLFASTGETVARDLTALRPESAKTQRLAVEFPVEHTAAWISAINQARLILGAVHDVTEADMTTMVEDLRTAKDHALLKIHLLGYLLELFMQMERGK
jgi:hypothetical protein